MAKDRIKLMISSRCTDKIRIGKISISLTELRERVLVELEKVEFLGRKLFDVEISEYFTEALDDTSWNDCLKKIDESDIVLIWFTGHEGYKDSGKSYGICYAEYLRALQSNPSKVFLLDFRDFEILDKKGKTLGDEIKVDSPFAKDIQQKDNWIHRIQIKKVTKADDLTKGITEKSVEILRNGIVKYILEGSKSLRFSKSLFGEGLQWSQLDNGSRSKRIIENLEIATRSFLSQIDFSKLNTAFRIHAIPGAMSQPEAREMVGRPFLKDQNEIGKAKSGPIHLVGVYKTATSTQVQDVIGHQDVGIITMGFGFYIWDFINHTQMIYLTNCKDPQTTTTQVDSFFTWLRVNNITEKVIDRAKRRYSILKVIQEQHISDL